MLYMSPLVLEVFGKDVLTSLRRVPILCSFEYVAWATTACEGHIQAVAEALTLSILQPITRVYRTFRPWHVEDLSLRVDIYGRTEYSKISWQHTYYACERAKQSVCHMYDEVRNRTQTRYPIASLVQSRALRSVFSLANVYVYD